MDTFERNGLRFPVTDSGPQDGPVAVLLHGFPQDRSCYDRLLPALHGRGLRTVVPVQRGYAATALPRGRRKYAVGELALDVVALLDAAGIERAAVVGHDWGGAVAWAVAGLRPDRVSSLTVLSTPHPAAFTESMVRSSQALMSGYMALFQLPLLPEWALRALLRPMLMRSGLPEPDARRYTESLAAPGLLTGALNWYRALPFSAGTDKPAFDLISVPTTYVWGNRDFALGRVAAERTAAHISGDYRFLELDAGHWLPENHPTDIAEAILDRCAGSPVMAQRHHRAAVAGWCR